MSMSAISADQFAEILRVVRETVREEMRAEFQGRRDAEEMANAEHQIAVLKALGFKEMN